MANKKNDPTYVKTGDFTDKKAAMGKGVAQILGENSTVEVYDPENEITLRGVATHVTIAKYEAAITENDKLQDTITALRDSENQLLIANTQLKQYCDEKLEQLTGSDRIANFWKDEYEKLNLDTNTLVNTAELDSIVAENIELKTDMGSVVSVLQGITGLFSGNLSPFQIPMAVGRIIANPKQMDAIKGLTAIIEKYTPKAENNVR